MILTKHSPTFNSVLMLHRELNKVMEAECYQKIGNIQERLGDLEKAIEFL